MAIKNKLTALKGPWKAVILKHGGDWEYQIRTDIAGQIPECGNYIATCNSFFEAMGFANANLISAAPDLYEALKNIENDDGSIPETIWAMRNAALKKAEGDPCSSPTA